MQEISKNNYNLKQMNIFLLMESKHSIHFFHFHFNPPIPHPPSLYTLHTYCCMFALHLGHAQGQVHASQAIT